jgi:hypothetical protein
MRTFLPAITVAALLFGGDARAVTFDFSGTFTSVSTSGGLVSQGEAFSGSVTYDPAAAAVFSPNPFYSNYSFYPAGSNGLVIQAGSFTFSADPLQGFYGNVHDHAPSSPYDSDGVSFTESDALINGFSNGGTFFEIVLNGSTNDSPQNPLTGTALPTAVDLGAWDNANVIVQTAAMTAYGTIDLPSPVPEPASIALMGFGGLALVSLRTRARRPGR